MRSSVRDIPWSDKTILRSTSFGILIFDDGDCRYIARELIESITNKDNDLRLADVFSLGKCHFAHPLTRISDILCIIMTFRTDIFGSSNPYKPT